MINTNEGKNSKLNTELNLVPFIDLLSSLVLFLLCSAVWLQVAAIPAPVHANGKSASASSAETKIDIHLTPQGYQLSWPASLSKLSLASTMGRKGKDYDRERLIGSLKSAVKNIKSISAAVSAEDAVNYEYVIETIDLAKSAGISTVGLSLD